jgi:hypothetical protein
VRVPATGSGRGSPSRGGFYGYDALENPVGRDIHSADQIVSDWQDVTVGDAVRLTPDVGLAVVAVQPRSSRLVRYFRLNAT